jgi:hypothetical protein
MRFPTWHSNCDQILKRPDSTVRGRNVRRGGAIMSVADRVPPPSVRRAQVLRQTWDTVSQRGSTVLRPALNFFVAFPPVAQGAYYLLTGLWPLLSLHTFLLVTGPKTDLWLVQTVGVLVAVIGLALLVAGYRRVGSPEVFCLALGSALGLAAIDVIFVFHGRISAVYLLDAAAQIGLVVLWLYGWRTGRSELRTCQPVLSAPPPQPPASGPANGVQPPLAVPVQPPR